MITWGGKKFRQFILPHHHDFGTIMILAPSWFWPSSSNFFKVASGETVIPRWFRRTWACVYIIVHQLFTCLLQSPWNRINLVRCWRAHMCKQCSFKSILSAMHITGNCDAKFTPLETFLGWGGAAMVNKKSWKNGHCFFHSSTISAHQIETS